MLVALIHWRIKPDADSVKAFRQHWQTMNTVADRSGLIGEFLSESLSVADFPNVTWHLDPESLGNFKSFVTVGLWSEDDAFKDQVAKYFNDENPLKDFEKYRRRRVVFSPVEWRIGTGPMPQNDSDGVA